MVALSVACTGSNSCDDLDGLRAQRDSARLAATEAAKLPAGKAREEALERAHDRMHTRERSVYDLEQSCR